MNRLESLRDVPDGAWTRTPRHAPRDSRRDPAPALSPFLLPWRVVRAMVRDPGRAWLMFRMVCVYVEVSILARVLALPRAFETISPRLSLRATDEVAVSEVVNALDTLLSARIPFIGPQCWKRAAVLHRFLRFEGVDTSIVFGVTTEGAEPVEAHAWLERSGVSFAEAPQSKNYRRVFEFPIRRSS